MKTRMGIVIQVIAFSSTIAAIAAAQTPPVTVSGQSDECFNQTGTIPLTCDIECVSSTPCEDYHVSVCSNTQIDEGIPGSANTLPGGTFAKTTCSQPSAPFGGSFTATGTWSGTNSVFFACVPSSLTGSTATFLISASDKTGQAATTTLTVPVCTSPYSISVNPSQTCFNPGGTFTIDVSGTNTTAGALTGFKVSECSPSTVIGETPGSANQPPAGVFTHSTCTLGVGGTWAASGSWPAGKADHVIFSFLAPTNAGATSLPFQFSISDSTDTPLSQTSSMPACTASGPMLQVTKELYDTKLVNGHVRVGDQIEYVITVKNVGSAPTTGTMSVTDALPAGLTLKEAILNRAECPISGNSATCNNLFTMDPGDEQFIFIFCTANRKGDFDNTATVNGGGAPSTTSNVVSVEVRDPRPSPNKSSPQNLREVHGRP